MRIIEVQDPPVREVPIRPQTEKPKWRGIVKLQVETMPRRGGSYLVTDRAGEVCSKCEPSHGLRILLGSRLKAYFRATILGDGTLVFGTEVRGQRW